MSAYTTLDFTRKEALDYLKSKLEEPQFTDMMIQDLMDIVLEPQLYNCLITDFPNKRN